MLFLLGHHQKSRNKMRLKKENNQTGCGLLLQQKVIATIKLQDIVASLLSRKTT